MGTFPGWTQYGNLGPSQQIKLNLQFYLEDAFVEIGGFTTIETSGEVNFNGTVLSEFKHTTDDSYPSGTYFESHSNRWVASSGLSAPTGMTAPVRPSGIYLAIPGSGYTYYPSGTANGNYNYNFDFMNGAVYFTNQNIVPPTSTLLAPHSYQRVYVGMAEDEEFENIITADTKEQALGSGTVDFPTYYDVELPAVFIQLLDRRWIPYELGGNKVAKDRLIFHIITEDQHERDQITDMIDALGFKSLQFVDYNSAPYPYNDMGDINPAYANYATHQQTHPWKKCYFENVNSRKFKSVVGFYRGEVVCELDTRSFV